MVATKLIIVLAVVAGVIGSALTGVLVLQGGPAQDGGAKGGPAVHASAEVAGQPDVATKTDDADPTATAAPEPTATAPSSVAADVPDDGGQQVVAATTNGSGGASPIPAGEHVLDDFTPPPGVPSDDLVAPGGNSGGPGGFAVVSPPTAVGAGLGGPDDLKGGPGCSIQCITRGVAYARGVGAKLVVETDTPAQIWIIVWNDDGYHTMVDSGAGGGDISFAKTFNDLEPGTTYQAMAVAEDGEGYSSHAYGSFTTLNRYVEISMSSADVSAHDYSNSTFSKHVWVEGQWLDEYAAYSLHLQGSTLNWGDNQVFVEHVGRHLDLAVQLFETNNGGDLCEASATLDEPESGKSAAACDTWAYAELYDDDSDLDDRPANATSWTEHTLQRTLYLPGAGALPPGYGMPLVFTVPVTLHVMYQ